MSQAELSVVVPVYNEAGFIAPALSRLIDVVDETGIDYEILVMENGSTDRTAEIAKEVGAGRGVRVVSLSTPDYGAAMREGFLRTTGTWVVNFDIDYFSGAFLSHVIDQPESVDLIIGSKRDPESEDKRPLLRRLATLVFNLMLKTILGSRVSDTHGMKGFRRALVDAQAPLVVSTGDLFDTELVIRAERADARIVEVPVRVEELRDSRSSLIKRVPGTVAGLFRIRRSLRVSSPSDEDVASGA